MSPPAADPANVSPTESSATNETFLPGVFVEDSGPDKVVHFIGIELLYRFYAQLPPIQGRRSKVPVRFQLHNRDRKMRQRSHVKKQVFAVSTSR